MSSNRRTGRQSISRSHAVDEEILKLNPWCEVTEDRTPESLDVPSTSPLPCELVRLPRKRLPIARLIGFKSAVAEVSLEMLLARFRSLDLRSEFSLAAKVLDGTRKTPVAFFLPPCVDIALLVHVPSFDSVMRYFR